MELLDRITLDPGLCGGRPCLRHYRFRVTDMLDLLAAGAPVEEILTDYPFLEPDDITAAILYADQHPDLRSTPLSPDVPQTI